MTTRQKVPLELREVPLFEKATGVWILRRPTDSWATAATRELYTAFMEDFVATRNWARSWKIQEGFHTNGVNRPVPRNVISDEVLLQAGLLPVLLFKVVTTVGIWFEVSWQFSRVNSEPSEPVFNGLTKAFDALVRQ